MGRPDKWVYGLRTDDPSGAAWQDVLLARLTGAYAEIHPGSATVATEAGLGFSVPQTYFYVRSSSPEFGFVVAAFDPKTRPSSNGGVDWCDSAVTPADTGGIWHGYTPLTVSLTPAQLRGLVRANSMSGSAYEAAFTDWISRAYSSPDQYAGGEKPILPGVPLVDLAATDDSRAWLWEARVPSVNGSPPACRPERLYMRPEDVTAYATWLRRWSPLTSAERVEHRSLIREILLTTDDPFHDATGDLQADYA